MGIKDLLRFMKPYIEPIHIKKYAGERVGIDAYSWLHRGAYSCSMEICLNSNSDKKWRYIDYCMHRINLLRHYEIVPVVVFDGGNIPCKAVTHQERHRKKEKNRELAMEKLKEGNVNAASELFQRAVNITPSIANQLIKLLREHDIEFVVAPYEADAQLAYLSSLGTLNGGIAAVITEDSDMIAYGCKATIFKMDRYGNGEEMMLDKIFDSAGCTPSFKDFDKELLTGMCVLAGCDFLPSVPGIGIARAYALVSKYRNLERALSALKLQKKEQMPEDYFKLFRQAMAVFQHAKIYDAETRKLIPMKPLPLELLQVLGEEIDFLGPDMPPSIAVSIAEGRLNPVTMEAFNYFSSEECNQDLIIKNKEILPRTEKAEVSEEESCFMVVAQTYCGNRVAQRAMERNPSLGNIHGDCDPIDICVLSTRDIKHGDLILSCRPIGGLRMIDDGEADDKIVAVLVGDPLMSGFTDITHIPKSMLDMLRHYFLTYKQSPDAMDPKVSIPEVYGREEAHEMIKRSMADYQDKFESLKKDFAKSIMANLRRELALSLATD